MASGPSIEEVNVMKFMRERSREISMATLDAKKKHQKQASQQLPFYMRRRSVSHNVKRLPRRLREKLNQPEAASKTPLKKPKRPSRKYRRRPKNLLSEYERRSGKNVWLETHIWFAKRFKMVEKWGYKLPLHSNDKSFRACYRGMTKHCLLQDLSYMCCVELLGPEGQLLSGLSQLTSPETGLSFAAKLYLSGTREGNAIVYHPNSYPVIPIGPVSFIWNQASIPKTPNVALRQIWLWCHPAMYEELCTLLVRVFNLKADISSQTEPTAQSGSCEPPPSKRIKTELKSEDSENDDRSLIGKSHRKFVGEQDIEINLLKDQLVRFRFTGPLSQAVLNEALQLDFTEFKKGLESYWWQTYYKDDELRKQMETQNSVWKEHRGLLSSAQLPPGAVIGLTVRDPRFSLPIKRTKARPQCGDWGSSISSNLIQYPKEVSNSPIWIAHVRDMVKTSMIQTSEVNRMRQEHFENCGEKLTGLGEQESRIPLLIIQNSGSLNLKTNDGCGCDVIIPSGWAMPFWISFVYREARVGGLREEGSKGVECGIPIFPTGYPDTASGKSAALEKREELMTQHFKYPPNKRPNFEILGVASPFYPLWGDIVFQWSLASGASTKNGSFKDFYILRNKPLLKELHKLCLKPTEAEIQKLIDKLRDSCDNRVLVFVKLDCEKSANASEFSAICLPDDSEIMLFKITNKPSGPVESSHKITINEKVKTKKAIEYIEKLPEGDGLVDLCSRKLLGYVIAGGFAFSGAHRTGNGFCSYLGLMNLLKSCACNKIKPLALLREQHSFNYHYATVTVPF